MEEPHRYKILLFTTRKEMYWNQCEVLQLGSLLPWGMEGPLCCSCDGPWGQTEGRECSCGSLLESPRLQHVF